MNKKKIYIGIFLLYLINFIMFVSFNNLKFTNIKTILYIVKNSFAIMIFYIINKCNLKLIKEQSCILYIGSIILLIFVHFLGIIGLGAKRWINLGIFYLQPSELMKICLPIHLSHFLSKNHQITLNVFLKYLLISGIPIFLVIIEPDLATGAILGVISVSLLFVSGISKKYIIRSIIAGVLCLPFIWFKMYKYQRQRILTFLGRGGSHTTAYQIIQSRIAIGSGGLFGKGFLNGSQFHNAFLPKPDTDFIFSCICEEWGFLGGFFVLSIFLYLSLLSIHTSFWKEDLFEKYLSLSIGMYVFASFFFNIAMTMGMIPVMGVPLPVLSRGGSASLTFLLSLGILNNIRNNISKKGS